MQSTDQDYVRPHVPPATPPVIDRNADPHDAAQRAHDSGDSDVDGTNGASLDRSAEEASIRAGQGDMDKADPAPPASAPGGDTINPGDTPDEIVPDAGDEIEPTGPSSIEVERGNVDDGGTRPSGIPGETLLPPD